MSQAVLEHDAPMRSQRETAPEGRHSRCLSLRGLRRQNRTYAGTGGISENNRGAGFVPGFFDTRTGTAVVSRFANGAPAPVHVLDGLPDAWVAQRDEHGRALRIRCGVIAGFLLGERFLTREQAAQLCAA